MYHEAATQFHRIIQEYPTTNKVPDALLKVTLTYIKLGKTESAQEMFRYLLQAYPKSEAARVGREKYGAVLGLSQ
jgi:TolA-binding protein